MAGDYTINNIYQGGYSSLSPSYGNVFTGYRVGAGEIGMSTDARTANVLQEVSTKLNMGIKNIELSQVDKGVFESIPKGHLKEVNRQAKLVGAEVTLHAPVIEPSGMGQQGFDEIQRKAVERQMSHAIERANELNPDGSSPVTFHSSVEIPGSQWKMTDEGKKPIKLMIVEQESGKIVTAADEETKHYPSSWKAEGKKTMTPEESLDALNNTSWSNSISELAHNKADADGIISGNETQIKHLMKDMQEGKYNPRDATPEQQQAFSRMTNARFFLEDAQLKLSGMFDKSYKFGTPEEKRFLTHAAEQFKNNLGILDPNKNHPKEAIEKARTKQSSLQNQSHAIQQMIEVMEHVNPKLYVPIEDFAAEKSSETFANVAFNSYKKFKDKAPIISIENPPIGTALATGEELKNLVETTKEKFIKKAIDKGYAESEAKKQADKLIGVTWDVGHINMLRKQGFKSKDIVKETEYVAPLVKHVHFSDNFGLEHTELPMGMGNVPVKEMMEKIGKEGFKGKKVVEAVSWWQHFKTPPFIPSLEAMGSPIYADGVGPYWNQAIGLQQGYLSGYGQILPQGHFETYGIPSFANLPSELGGQRAGGGGGSRMSGKGME